MTPAQQRLEAGNPPALQVDEGLKLELELVRAQGFPQVMLELPPRAHALFHLRHEEAVHAPPLVLGREQRKIGIAQKYVRLDSASGSERYPDARSDRQPMRIEREGGDHCLDNALSERCRMGRSVVGLFDLSDHEELVAPEAAQEVAVIHAMQQAACDLLQECIADQMAERVVHLLEAVEIDEQDGD